VPFADTSPQSGSFALLLMGRGLMKNVHRKFWLMAGALLCLAPAAFAGPSPFTTRKSVPEGGSVLVYVLGAGITCIGAMLVRFHAVKRQQT